MKTMQTNCSNMHSDLSIFAEDSLGAHQTGVANEFITDCINCGKDGDMSFNAEKGVGQCYVCGYSFNLVQLLQDLEGISWPEAVIKAEQLQRGILEERTRLQTLNDLRSFFSSVSMTVDSAPIVLPEGCIPITADPQANAARNYLCGRGFSPSHYNPFQLMYVSSKPSKQQEKRYYRHLVFPTFDKEGNVECFTTRAAYEPTGGIPKSYHPPSSRKAATLYGESLISHNMKTVIVVEGPLDAIALRGFAVAILGKNISEVQVRRIRDRFSTAVVCLDSDAMCATHKVAGLLRSSGMLNVLTAACPWKDPGDSPLYVASVAEAVKCILRGSSKESLLSEMQSKLQVGLSYA